MPALTEIFDADLSSDYGYCPVCGAPCESRERRPGGNDTCASGCTYPSADAVRHPEKRLDWILPPERRKSDRATSDCGANGPGGGGFREGNTCAQRDGASIKQTDTPEFKRWFGDSKVVDENGEPLVVYHGTNRGFSQFRDSTNAHSHAIGVPVYFFTPDTDLASAYAASANYRGDGSEQIMPVYLSAHSPVEVDANGRQWHEVLSDMTYDIETWRTPEEKAFREYRKAIGDKYAYEFEFEMGFEIPAPEQQHLTRLAKVFESQLTDRDHPIHRTSAKGVVGYDGLIVRNVWDRPPVEHSETASYSPYTDVYAVFSPTQIKSATGNEGTFDPDNPDIRKTDRKSALVDLDVLHRRLKTATTDGRGDISAKTANATVEQAARQTQRNPSKAQIEAGNYRKGKARIHGFEVSIENPKGSTRSGVAPDGKKWSVKMQSHYGYILLTKGADGDHVDVFIGPHPESEIVFVIDQIDKSGKFDEHKVMLGWDNQKEAKAAYLANYDDGWKCGPITAMTIAEFKQWVRSKRTRKPVKKRTKSHPCDPNRDGTSFGEGNTCGSLTGNVQRIWLAGKMFPTSYVRPTGGVAGEAVGVIDPSGVPIFYEDMVDEHVDFFAQVAFFDGSMTEEELENFTSGDYTREANADNIIEKGVRDGYITFRAQNNRYVGGIEWWFRVRRMDEATINKIVDLSDRLPENVRKRSASVKIQIAPHGMFIAHETVYADSMEPEDLFKLYDKHLKTMRLKTATADKSECGANAPGGGGFQPGNTCAEEEGERAVSAETSTKEYADAQYRRLYLHDELIAYQRKRYEDGFSEEHLAALRDEFDAAERRWQEMKDAEVDPENFLEAAKELTRKAGEEYAAASDAELAAVHSARKARQDAYAQARDETGETRWSDDQLEERSPDFAAAREAWRKSKESLRASESKSQAAGNVYHEALGKYAERTRDGLEILHSGTPAEHYSQLETEANLRRVKLFHDSRDKRGEANKLQQDAWNLQDQSQKKFLEMREADQNADKARQSMLDIRQSLEPGDPRGANLSDSQREELSRVADQLKADIETYNKQSSAAQRARDDLAKQFNQKQADANAAKQAAHDLERQVDIARSETDQYRWASMAGAKVGGLRDAILSDQGNAGLNKAMSQHAEAAGADAMFWPTGQVTAGDHERGKVKASIVESDSEAMVRGVHEGGLSPDEVAAAAGAMKYLSDNHNTTSKMDVDHAASNMKQQVKLWMSDERISAGVIEATVKSRSEGMSQNMLDAWAESSTDGNPVSGVLQIAVAEHFGDRDHSDIRALEDGSRDMALHVYQKHKPVFDHYVRSVYERTQKQLADAGVEEVVLFRGVSPHTDRFSDDAKNLIAKNGFGAQRATVQLNPVSSFTTHFETTSVFSGADSHDDHGTVMAMKVPRSRIWCTATTGPGCLTESEVLVIGGEPLDGIMVSGGVGENGPRDLWDFSEAIGKGVL